MRSFLKKKGLNLNTSARIVGVFRDKNVWEIVIEIQKGGFALLETLRSKTIFYPCLAILFIGTIVIVTKYETIINSGVWSIFGLSLALLFNIVMLAYLVPHMSHSTPIGNKDDKGKTIIDVMLKNEKRRSFENYFFNILRLQESIFESFKISFGYGSDFKRLERAAAVINIEDVIESKRSKNATDKEIAEYLKVLDNTDEIHRVIRTFSNAIKIISDKLCDENGFTAKDRKSNYLTLINFTDFSVLRLVIIACQFLDYEFITTIKDNREFSSVFTETGLKWDLY